MASGEQTKLEVLITARNTASKNIKSVRKDISGIGTDTSKMSKSVKRSSDDVGKSFASLKRYGALAGAAIAGMSIKLGVNAVSSAAKFSKSMSNVSTLIDDNVESMDNMKEEVLEMSKRLPVSLDDLASSLYDIRSAGIEADQAMGMLEQSAILATAGLASTKEATNILTSAINSFEAEGLSTAKTANILFQTVKAGKTTISELSMSFGASAPVIADAGVKLMDFQAATAALTTTGLPASQAQMGLRQAIVALIKPTTDMEKIFKVIGVDTGKELIDTSDNMGDVFMKVKDAADKNNISFEKSVGSVEALNAITGITTTTSETYIQTLKDMEKGSTELDDAFIKQNDEASAQYEILKNQLNVEMIKLGTKILPELILTMQAIPFLPEVWREWKENVEKVIKVIENLISPISRVTDTIDAWKSLGGAIKKVWDNLKDVESSEHGSFDKINKHFSAKGGIVPQHLDTGGVVHASGGFFEPRGTDTIPAMLTPGEMVLNAGQQSSLFNQLNGEKGRNVTININGEQHYYNEQSVDNLIDKIRDVLSREQEKTNWGIA